jgi:hypothetical protein
MSFSKHNATALWLIGRSQSMAEFAAPEHDQGALEEAVRVAKIRSVRKRPSLYGATPAPGPVPSGSDGGSKP